jgi:uncharacterized protein involved in type VI secretion and phage assembly
VSLNCGVTTGHVIKVDDPDGMGRVKVRFDRLGTGKQSTDGFWAPVATLMSGPDRGSWVMPEPEDEVLIAFDNCDVNFPYVIGYLWNGKQKPPVSGIDEHTRRLKTVSGHILEFADVKGKEKIHLQTQLGHQVTLDDTSGTGSISVVTKHGNSIEMDDGQDSITVQTQGKTVSIQLKDSGDIDIQTPSGAVNVTCDQVSITATSSLSITSAGSLDITASDMSITAGTLDVLAALTMCEGVVQATAVIADAVVGSAYTPAPGDTLGL